MYADKKNNKARNAPSKKLIKRNIGIGAAYDLKCKFNSIISLFSIDMVIESAMKISVIKNIIILNIYGYIIP